MGGARIRLHGVAAAREGALRASDFGAGLGLPASLSTPRWRLLGDSTLTVEDLLEDLAHARPHQVALFRRRLSVAAPDPLGLPGVQVVVHGSVSRPRPPG